jgi:hypothetical protein
MSRALAQAIREVLVVDTVDDWWSNRARDKIQQRREEFAFLPASGSTLVPEPLGFRLWNFAGGRGNNLLAKVLEAELGQRVTTGNLGLGFRDEAAKSGAAIAAALRRLAAAGRPTDDEAVRFVPGIGRARLTKFRACLPEVLEGRYVAATLLDAGEARLGMVDVVE